jgi:hypothetical protein
MALEGSRMTQDAFKVGKGIFYRLTLNHSF